MLEETSIALATPRCRVLRVGTVRHGVPWTTLDRLIPGIILLASTLWRADPAGNVYVGGLFRQRGGWKPPRKYRSWGRRGWLVQKVGFSQSIYALAVGLDGSVYAGGEFTIARWDGLAWHPMGSGLTIRLRVGSRERRLHLRGGKVHHRRRADG